MARILVVDDSPTTVHFLRRLLSENGHAVETLDSFVRLAEHVRQSPPDLIILDLSLPALPGVKMGQLIRRYQCRDVPIVVYSSQPEEELIEATRLVGAVDFVSKKEDPARLVEAVHAGLGKGAGPARGFGAG